MLPRSVQLTSFRPIGDESLSCGLPSSDSILRVLVECVTTLMFTVFVADFSSLQLFSGDRFLDVLFF